MTPEEFESELNTSRELLASRDIHCALLGVIVGDKVLVRMIGGPKDIKMMAALIAGKTFEVFENEGKTEDTVGGH